MFEESVHLNSTVLCTSCYHYTVSQNDSDDKVRVFLCAGPVVYVLDLADRLISKACPFAAAGIMVGSIYWTAVTYGAVTVMQVRRTHRWSDFTCVIRFLRIRLSVSQVVGHKEGLDVMERADPLFLLIGLPTIPVMLILGKMIRWEDYVLRLWRKYSTKLQILNSIFPGQWWPDKSVCVVCLGCIYLIKNTVKK